MPAIQVGKFMAAYASCSPPGSVPTRGASRRRLEFAQAVGIQDANLLFCRGQCCPALGEQRHAALVGVQRLLQGHLAGLHGRDDALQFGQSGFE
jgi:hypothetical protein